MGALGKTDDVRRYVVAYRRKIERPGKPAKYKTPKIQRLITPKVKSRRRRTIILRRRRVEKGRKEAQKYNAMIAKRRQAKYEEEVRLGIRKRKRTKSRLGSTTSAGAKRKASEKKSTKDKPQKKQKKGQKSQKKGKKGDKKKQPKKQKSQKAGGKGKKGKKSK